MNIKRAILRRAFFQFTSQTKMLLVSACLALSLFSSGAHAQFVSTQGTDIVDANGNRIYFNGMNLGNWLLWEGYLMMGDFEYRTHTQFLNSLGDALGSMDRAREFEHQWRLNYVTEQTVIDLKNLGYNSVRVPFHYNMFWNNGAVSNHGFQYFDRLIEWCRTHRMYILLDMHAAPGYQNPGDHSDNVNSNSNQPRNTVRFWDGNNINIASQVWRHIANRYKNEMIIWGYDLINEPVLPSDERRYELLPSLIAMRNAIREVDNNHIIVAEGAWWASNLDVIDWTNSQTQSATGVSSAWDDKLVYQTHHYVFGNVAWLDFLYERDDITNRMGIPLILGEYGEDNNDIIRTETEWAAQNIAGAFPWSFKKMTHDRTLWTIQPNDVYMRVRNYIKNGGNRPTDAYNGMIAFAQNNIKNGRSDLQFHQGFYEASIAQGPSCTINAPANLNGNATANRIDLSWSDRSNNENSFEVRRNGNRIATLGRNTTSYRDSGLNSNTCYDYQITAVGDCSASVQKQICTTCGGSSQSPYSGTPAAVPGTIQAENYDLGCSAYSDTTPGNAGGAYRNDDVDIGTTGDSSGYNVGWVDAGDWMKYTVDVDRAGSYKLEYRVATPENSGKIQLRLNGQILAEKSIASTGGWGTYRTVRADDVTLPAGQQQLQIYFNGGLVNLNWFRLTLNASATPTPTPPPNGNELANGTYSIISKTSGKALDVYRNSANNGAKIVQWRFHGNDNQLWNVTRLSDGSYRIVSKSSDKSLDIPMPADQNGDRIQQWQYNGGTNQRWNINRNSDGSYNVRSVKHGKALDLVDGSQDNGAEIQVWDYSAGNSNQAWEFSPR